MLPNTTRCTQTWVYGPMGGRIGCVHSEKFWCDFMARTCALIAPVQPVCTEFRDAPKHYVTHQNMSLWSNEMDRVCSLRKFPMWFHGTNFALIAPVQPVLQWVSCSNEILPNAPKHYEAHQNISLWSNVVDRVCSLRKIPMRFHGTNFCFNCTSSTCFAPSFV